MHAFMNVSFRLFLA